MNNNKYLYIFILIELLQASNQRLVSSQMEQIVFTKKSEAVYSTNDVLKVFNTTDNLEEIGNVVGKAQERLYVTWASVDAKDNAGEHIPIQDIIKNQETLIKRGGTITDSHTNAHIGKTLSYKILTHPDTQTTGVLHLNKIYDDNILDDKVWRETQTGERTGSSVGGFSDPKGTKFTHFNGDIVKELAGFTQFETANVKKPCNPYATNVAVSQVAKGDEKMDQKTQDLMNNLEQKKKGEDPKPVKTEESADVVDDSSAFVNKDEFSALVEAVNQLKDIVAGLTSGAAETVDEAVEEAPENMEAVEEGTGISALDNKEEAEKEDDEVAKTMKSLQEENAKLKQQLADKTVAKVVKSDARVEDKVTNAKEIAHVKKHNDLLNDAMSGKLNWDEALYD